ncbi:cation:proton antiporter [Sediminispirochaeta bajacaliforniensis]|uniref:cation:proton antiporter n=1 Tax=Sediminispirochaeta bajacaliforniensis TaxID=148 RepID=UPI00035D24D2|nr:cation:proton antiporter [Sediminispirochaeta bajacaliforniensis]
MFSNDSKRPFALVIVLFSSLAVPVLLLASESVAESGPYMTHLMTLLILQLSFIVIASRFLGWIFSRYLRQPKVLGELVAGMVVGPYALGRLRVPVLDSPLFPLPAGTLPVSPELYGFAVVASIVLLFFAGLETDLPTFLRFSMKGSLVGFGGVVVSFFLGDMVAVLFLPAVHRFMHPTALFLGTLSTATSVGITARILSEKKKMSSPEGVTILAAAVLDDVLGIILLAVVVGVAKVASAGGHVHWGHIGIIAAKAFGFWLISTVLGIIFAPKLSRRLKRLESMEMVASVSFGIALFLSGLSEMAGLAMIIGAYVVGLSLSQTDIAFEIQEKLHGIYDFMVPIFFAIMGMMVDFSALPAVLGFGALYVLVAFAGKLIGCGLPALATGFNVRGALRIGAGMLPRGEVTLIVAGIGLASGAIGPEIFGVAIMTLLAAGIAAPPLLIKSFHGGSGYTKSLDTGSGSMKTIELEFPSKRMAEFVISEVLNGFRGEEFFVQPVDHNRQLYNLRKDDIQITLKLDGTVVQLSTVEEHEPFVRLLMLEVLLDLKEFVQSIESMKSPDMMGTDLLLGIFGEPTSGKSI